MKHFFTVVLLMIIIPTETFASVVIASLLPNPLGDDTIGEYIELRNIGCMSIDIGNYSLSDASGKVFHIPDSTVLDSHESRKFLYSETKISLNNTGNESLYLKDQNGTILDSYEYSGTQKDNVIITLSINDESCSEEIPSTSSGVIEISTGALETIGSTNSGTIDTFTGMIIHSSGSTTATGEVLTEITSSGSITTNTGSSNTAFSGSTTSGTTEVYPTPQELSGSTTEGESTGSIASGTISIIENTGGAVGSGNVITENPLPSFVEIGPLLPIEMYYSDSDGNKKIDMLEISYPYILTGIVNTGAISLYSNTGGLSSSRVNTFTGYILFGTLSGNILVLKIQEGDQEKSLLKISNTTTSDLRLKSSGDLGFRSLGGKTPEPLFLTSSFSEYKNVYSTSLPIILTGTGEISLSGSSMNEGSAGATLTGTLSTGSLIIANTGVIFPTIIPTLQSPTNATLSGELFTCTSNDCRINLTLEPIFSSGFLMKDFLCYFGTSEVLTLDTDCNPNTLYFSASGNLIIELISKKYREEKSRKSYPIEWRVSNPNTQPNTSTVIPSSIIDTGKPIARIKMDGKWKDYYEQIGDYELNCYAMTCSVNFSAEESIDPEGSAIRWLWIYGINDISTSRDPGTKKYSIGDHKITLRVIDSSGNFDEITYIIHVLGVKPKPEKVKESKKSKIEKMTKVISANIIKKKKPKKIKMILFSPPEMLLQGRTGKIVSPFSYSCLYKKKPLCTINFSLSGALRGYEYGWSLDGKEVYRGKNPPVWKLSPGIHKGTLSSYYKDSKVALHTSIFSIQVASEPKKPKKPKQAKTKKVSIPQKKQKLPMIFPEANASNDEATESSSSYRDIGFFLFFSGILLGFLVQRRRKV